MKNYEVKYATKEFADLGTIKLSSKRLAYLVPNMFGKMKNGFYKRINGIITLYQEELSTKVIENQPVEAPIQQTVVESQPVVQETNTQDNSNLNKSYLLKVLIADVEELSKKTKKTISSHKKLLISQAYVR